MSYTDVGILFIHYGGLDSELKVNFWKTFGTMATQIIGLENYRHFFIVSSEFISNEIIWRA